MMIVKCAYKTCLYCKNGKCNRVAIELMSFDYLDEKKKKVRDLNAEDLSIIGTGCND